MKWEPPKDVTVVDENGFIMIEPGHWRRASMTETLLWSIEKGRRDRMAARMFWGGSGFIPYHPGRRYGSNF